MKTPSLLALSLLAVGCGPYLQYKAQPPAPSLQGKVVVEVRDAREPGKGGNQHEQVGVHTGTFGIPDEIRVDGPMVVTDTMQELVSQAAEAAGIGVTRAGDPAATARVVVDVQRLWCAGYNPAYKGDVTAGLMITDPTGQQVRVPAQPLHAEDGGMDCKRIYKKALTDFFKATRALFETPPIRAAATGIPTAGPPP